VFSRANAARRADARARHTSAWGVCLSHDSSLHDVREDVVWCESCAITPLAVAMASTTNAKKNANGKIARATTALKARKTTSEKRGRRDARAPNTGRGHRRGNASGKRKSDEKSTTAKRSKTNEMTKEDFEIGMEVSVKGPANAVWCAEIVDVRSRRKAPLEVKWFDSASASASAGEYSYWDCMKNDKVEIKVRLNVR